MITAIDKFPVRRTEKSRISETDFNNLPFGRVFSDHMFIADYVGGEWKNLEICPYGKIQLAPSASALHYGQAIFEGMKAYKTDDGSVQLFRPSDNIKRLNKSAARMSMPEVPEEIFMDALMQLVSLDRNWVPQKDGYSLYIRPVMFAVDEFVGVKASESYKFIIFTSPTGTYYTEPVRVKIETTYTRACEGGIGYAKAAGNYAASLYPAKQAQKQGFHQLVWTDAKEHKYIEESGTMNVMFIIGDTLVTPTLTTNTILPGVTRDSVLTLARHWGMKVEERRISVGETLNGAFGTGTAATIAQIIMIHHNGNDYNLPSIEKREFSNKARKFLQDLQRGREQDIFNWMVKVC
jgi:branched-chain amino acid aminotransferase